ncbi:death-associated protein 1 [Anabrus simplex]|uniref:death-associated protein 1 n=1 Tax=Anabrus simplex TaxID=316456 RepID=UPI0034DD3522
MSSEETGLKAGHPPAVKAGGMRITQHKGLHEKEPKSPKDAKETGELDASSTLKVSTSPPKTVSISGAPVRGNADFPTEAVQSFHDKIIPAHDNRNPNSSRPHVIQQPRK